LKKLAVIAVCSILFVSVVGCGKASDTNAPKSGAAASNDSGKKLTITMMAPSFQGGGWPSNNDVIQKLDEKLNIDLQIQWVPFDTLVQKENVMAASNSFPDVYYVLQNEYVKWRDKNIFLDVKPFLNQYPNLVKQITPESLQMENPKDKYFGLPYYIQDTRDSFAIRKDWLDKLGLKMPTTVDEFAQVAKAFATQDPDGNGQQDTSGFSFGFNPSNTFSGLEPIQAAFGLGNEWIKQGDQLINYKTQTKELKQFVAFLNKMYKDGGLDKDFATNKVNTHKDKFVSSKVGIAEYVPGELLTTSFSTLKKAVPTAEIAQLLPPKGPDGKQGTQTNPMTSKIVINNSIDKEKQQRILKLLDYMVSDEGYDLIKNGVEGVHFKSENGKFVKLDAYDKDRPQLLSTWFFRRFDPLIQMHKWDDPNLVKQVQTWSDNNAKYPWPNPGAEIVSDVQSKLGPNADQKWMAAITKIIMGEAPIDAVDQAAADWLKNGGDQITKDYNEQYKKLHQ
jgi:ABC-type glycerol-3-phosphate transport system substrate-binding protein